ncbi:hypothetical protein ADUPG1_001100, partial [Aduncisulcus paluster]
KCFAISSEEIVIDDMQIRQATSDETSYLGVGIIPRSPLSASSLSHYKKALYDTRRILALPLLPTHLLTAINTYIVPKFTYLGTIGFITQEQSDKIDTEMKKKICKVLHRPFESFPRSYLHTAREDGGAGVASVQQTIDISRAGALLEALSDMFLKDSFLNDFISLTAHEWNEDVLSFTYTSGGDICRTSSPQHIRLLNLNWLAPLLSVKRLGLSLKLHSDVFSLVKTGSTFSVSTRSTHLLRRRINAINHAEWTSLACGRCAPYLKKHPTSSITFNRATQLTPSLILMRSHLTN